MKVDKNQGVEMMDLPEKDLDGKVKATDLPERNPAVAGKEEGTHILLALMEVEVAAQKSLLQMLLHRVV